jgi:hypothetical protein
MQDNQKMPRTTGGEERTTDKSKPVEERTGSQDHNDYRIEGEEAKRDEKESYTDYNGNSEANNPARAGG